MIESKDIRKMSFEEFLNMAEKSRIEALNPKEAEISIHYSLDEDNNLHKTTIKKLRF